MFGNLIESSSHKGDYKRKGSFFVGTLALYAVAFLVIGVGSIFAYSTQVESPDLTLVSLVTPVDSSEVIPVREPARHAGGGGNGARPIIVRTPPPTTDPTFVTTATPVSRAATLPLNTNFSVGIPTGPQDVFGTGHGDGSGTRGNGNGAGAVEDLNRETPPPAMTIARKEPPKVLKISTGPINGRAEYLPKPVYSPLAKAAGAQGVVTVQLLVDENGKVISAHAVSGNPLLLRESVQAAYQARFSPTTLGGVAVKVSGVITYNFVLR